MNMASGKFIGAQGNPIGTAALREGPYGVIIRIELRNLQPGWHGLHIHNKGRCDPPEFETAGDHFNPSEVAHGYKNISGVHSGDLANIYVGVDGTAKAEMVSNLISLGGKTPNIFDADGVSLVVDANPDNYESIRGEGYKLERVTCAVLKKGKAK